MSQDIDEKISEQCFNEGLRFIQLHLPGPAIRVLKKCIECKKTESHKACYELAKIYVKLEDFESAYEYSREAMRLNPKYIQALYYIAHILKLRNIPMADQKIRMEAFILEGSLDYIILADIFYMEEYYETALEYIEKYEAKKILSDNIKLSKVKCLLRSSRYNECIQYINTIPENDLYYFKLMMYKIICLVLSNEYELIWKIINKFSYARLNSYNKKILNVYIQFYNIVTDSGTTILCEDENNFDHTEIIFELLDILLVNKEFYYFEKALHLLNLISDKSVLLQLGKLYYKHEYFELAKKEIIRSIKLFDVIDVEGIEVLL